ncbi:hypothetical protein C8R43DRAFT_1135457 [Mycena crocata]|nr:hypothetical protein C8R43DRAFT_1135457 [Mycena crocata]
MSSPSLVGGIAICAYDLPGAIVFAAAYGLLIPVFIYRLIARRSRTAVVWQVICFAIERVVLFTLRAVVAARPNSESLGLSEYMQATFALGFITLVDIVSRLVRSVLVNSTRSSSQSSAGTCFQPPLVSSSSGSLWKFSAPPRELTGDDDPRRRFWFRRWSECMLVLYLAALVTAIVATAHFYGANDPVPNNRNQALRYASTVIGFVEVLSLNIMLLWARRNVPRIDRRAVSFLLTLTTLLLIPPIYRLTVMHYKTPELAAANHQAQNEQTDKAVFYVFHVLPEWIVAAIACAANVKEICQTGDKGDEEWRDPTAEEVAKRERKAREKEMKKAAAKNAALELKITSRSTDSSSTLA